MGGDLVDVWYIVVCQSRASNGTLLLKKCISFERKGLRGTLLYSPCGAVDIAYNMTSDDIVWHCKPYEILDFIYFLVHFFKVLILHY